MTRFSTPLGRALVGASAAALLLGGLTGCSLLPTLPGGGGSGGGGTSNGGGTTTEADELVGTTWSGVDSDGDSWGLELQEDGTVGLEYNGAPWDDPADVWSLNGSTISFHINFDDGDVDMEGEFRGLDQPMDLDGSYPGGTFTVTLTRD